MIGVIGDVVFSVSENHVNTFKDLKRDISAKYATHEVINSKAKVEFLGVNLQTCSFSIELDRKLGININSSIEKWERYCKESTVLRFVLGGTIIGTRWNILSVGTAYNVIYSSGLITRVSIDLSLQEYN